MLSPHTFIFFENIKHNNHKEWFQANQEAYKAVRKDVIQLATELIAATSAFDMEVAQTLLEPKKCLTRINRDLRFSKNKQPYKTGLFITLKKEGKKSPFAGYYLNIEPGNSFAGGGVYNPEPEYLFKFRQEIDYCFEEWKGIVTAPAFREVFPRGVEDSGQLTRVPKGFDTESAAIDFIKKKGFFTTRYLTDREMCHADMQEKILGCYRASQPLIHFLNRALDTPEID